MPARSGRRDPIAGEPTACQDVSGRIVDAAGHVLIKVNSDEFGVAKLIRLSAQPMLRRNNKRQSERPLLTSHFWIRSATWPLFLSIMIMCELPCRPASGRSTTSTLPPAALSTPA